MSTEFLANFLAPDTSSIDIRAHLAKIEVLSHYEPFIGEETGSVMAVYNCAAFGVVLVHFLWKEQIHI